MKIRLMIFDLRLRLENYLETKWMFEGLYLMCMCCAVTIVSVCARAERVGYVNT